MNKHLVFVYGTLKMNEGNNYLLVDAEFEGFATTRRKFLLLNSSPYSQGGFPYLIDENDEIPYPGSRYIQHIQGEVYEVNDDTLARLDQLEGHPNWYERQREIVRMDDGITREVWIYIMPFSNTSCGFYPVVNPNWSGSLGNEIANVFTP